MKTLILASVALATVGLSAAIAQPAPNAKRAMAPETRTDVQAHAQKMFARLDANKDGFVTQAEADAAHAQRVARHQQRAQRRDPAKMFDRLDTNRDGQVTRAEADAARAARAAKANRKGKPDAAHASLLFERADTNRDGKLTRAELAALPKGPHGSLPSPAAKNPPAARFLAAADANKDGRLSLAEMQQQGLQRFDRLDTNRDGKLTPEERKQARQQKKAQRKPG